jgi:hypothetical protein
MWNHFVEILSSSFGIIGILAFVITSIASAFLLRHLFNLERHKSSH